MAVDESVIDAPHERRSSYREWLAIIFLGLSGAPLLLLAPHDPAATWVWLALWAPAAGSLAATLRSTWASLCVPFLWAACLGLGPLSPDPILSGMGAVTVLYMLGLATGRGTWSWGTAAFWLTLSGGLTALPVAAGLWVEPPHAEMLVMSLNFSPVLWVTECAGLDWMRHATLYEVAGSGDLGPQLRMAWSSGVGTLFSISILGVVAVMRRQAPPVS